MTLTRCGLTAITLVAFLSLAAPGRSQQVEVGAQALLNLPSSPLKLGISTNGRHLEADNVSGGTVVEYQTGCVAEEPGKITIQSQFKPIKLELLPAGPGKAQWFTEIDFKDLYFCRDKNSKIAVVRVSFADGSEWRIRP